MEGAYGLRAFGEAISADYHVGNADLHGVTPGWRASGPRPPNTKDIESLRAFPKLERLGTDDAKTGGGLPGQPLAESWMEWDAGKK
jgi:hypothetical protein